LREAATKSCRSFCGPWEGKGNRRIGNEKEEEGEMNEGKGRKGEGRGKEERKRSLYPGLTAAIE